MNKHKKKKKIYKITHEIIFLKTEIKPLNPKNGD